MVLNLPTFDDLLVLTHSSALIRRQRITNHSNPMITLAPRKNLSRLSIPLDT